MPLSLGRRALFRTGLALVAGWVALPSRACEVVLPNLRLLHPWTRASAPGAGTAIVNLVIEDVTEADRLVGVRCLVAGGAQLGGPGARAEVDLEIPAGRSTLLGEEGTHILLTDLRTPLHVGRAYPLLVMFERGGIASTSLSIDFPHLGPATARLRAPRTGDNR
jgi:copper(I)-binding protein